MKKRVTTTDMACFMMKNKMDIDDIQNKWYKRLKKKRKRK